jgi:hypothetical protein
VAGPGDTAGGTQYRSRMRDSATAGTPRRRLPAVVAANPRGAIYGTIVATAVIAATAAGGKSPALILAATVATLLVFWLAHVYADFLDHGLRHGRSDLTVLVSIMGQELSMLAAPALSILFLLLGRSAWSARGWRCALPSGTAWPSWSDGASTWAAGAGRHGRGAADGPGQRRLRPGHRRAGGVAALTATHRRCQPLPSATG